MGRASKFTDEQNLETAAVGGTLDIGLKMGLECLEKCLKVGKSGRKL